MKMFVFLVAPVKCEGSHNSDLGYDLKAVNHCSWRQRAKHCLHCIHCHIGPICIKCSSLVTHYVFLWATFPLHVWPHTHTWTRWHKHTAVWRPSPHVLCSVGDIRRAWSRGHVKKTWRCDPLNGRCDPLPKVHGRSPLRWQFWKLVDLSMPRKPSVRQSWIMECSANPAMDNFES